MLGGFLSLCKGVHFLRAHVGVSRQKSSSMDNLSKRTIVAACIMLFLGPAAGFTLGESLGGRQEPARTVLEDRPSPIIVQIGDYIITAKDLEQIINTYPEGSLSSRDAKRRLIESLITTKLFSLAARSAKLDLAEDFPKAKEKARQNALIYAYFLRFVKPKFSADEARKYFAAHKDEYQDFTFSRTQVTAALRDQVLTETNRALMQEWGVEQRDDRLKDVDLKNPKDPSLVLAEIGPVAVTVADLKQFAAEYMDEAASNLETKKYLMEILVLERLYALAAEKAGLPHDPEVRKSLEWSEDQLLAGRYARLVNAKVTLEDARRYYVAHPEEFKRSDQIRLRQIVVPTEKEAHAVLARLQGGAQFEELARTLSSDRASASTGGDIGWVRKGALHPDVEKAAFQLKPKQVSQPIKTPDGYHILLLEERLEGMVRPADEVMPNLFMQLQARAVEAERQQLMTIYKVTINDKLLD
jgi:peptidyl-prolyl cis-trans isomerase C